MGLFERAAYLAGRGAGVATGAAKIAARAPGEVANAYKEGRSGSVDEYDRRAAEDRTRRNVQREIKERERQDAQKARDDKRIRDEEARRKREEATQKHRRAQAEHERKELNIRRKEVRNVEINRSNQRRLDRANRPAGGSGGYGSGGSSDSILGRMNNASDVLTGSGQGIGKRMRDIEDSLR
jgi:hypothetical protein